MLDLEGWGQCRKMLGIFGLDADYLLSWCFHGKGTTIDAAKVHRRIFVNAKSCYAATPHPNLEKFQCYCS
jgi:hypothetical protein